MTDAAYGQTWAQLLDAEHALRALAEAQLREYVNVLEQLALSLAPAEVDARKRDDPACFKRLTAPEWLAFFSAGQGGLMPPAGAHWDLPAAADAASGAPELNRLRDELRVVRAENNRLRDLTQQLRQEKTALAAALRELKEKERGERTPAQRAKARPAEGAAPAEADAAEPVEAQPPGVPDQPGRSAAQPAAPAPAAADLPAPPAKYARLFDNWPVQGRALVALATTGWSLRQAVLRRVAEQLGVTERDKSLQDLFGPLAQRNLIHQATESIEGTVAAGAPDGQVRIAILRLTNLGQRVLNEIGVTPAGSEWGRLEARDGAGQVKHSAWVCALADHARQRGYQTEVCPSATRPPRPDLLLVKGAEQIYAVVRGAEPAAPWAELTDAQGAVALCAPTRQVRQHLVADAKAAGIVHGRATDLELLLAGDDRGALWAETW